MSTTNFSHSAATAPLLIEAAHSHAHGAHVVQFYTDDGFLLDGLTKFIGTALAAGDGAILIATKSHRDGLAGRLRGRGFDPAQAIQQGRYMVLDAAETLSRIMLNGFPNEALVAEILGSAIMQVTSGSDKRVVAFGEMVALLWEQGKAEAAIQLEELWNGLARTHSFSLRCAYSMHQFAREEHGESFLKICAVHQGVIPGEDYTSLASEDDRSRVIASLQQKAHALATEIAERRVVEEELRRSKAELESLVEQRTVALRQLSARLLKLQDSERRRIARELHDCLGQYLVGLKLNVDMLRQSPGHEGLWSESEHLMQQCITEVRTLSYLLHPPTMDAAGLASAAEWFVEGFSKRTGINVTLTASSIDRLPDIVELTLFRSLQEALTNVHRHSGASNATIRIHRSGEQVILEIQDDGCGIEQNMLARFRKTGNGMGVGLSGMCERVRDLGGTFQIDADLSGTAVRIEIPVTESACS